MFEMSAQMLALYKASCPSFKPAECVRRHLKFGENPSTDSVVGTAYAVAA